MINTATGISATRDHGGKNVSWYLGTKLDSIGPALHDLEVCSQGSLQPGERWMPTSIGMTMTASQIGQSLRAGHTAAAIFAASASW
jgi:hypothetical protein